MGVPSFFKWLTKKWPRVVTDVKEERIEDPVTGEPIFVDTSKPNPNGQEFDCLYLDMNGIIHPCCHPEDRPAPPDEESMLVAIGRYIDRIFAMVRPRKLLFMAIDGVAPRAKMNQQRSRRFRAALDVKLKEEEEERLREQWKAEGKEKFLPPKKPRPWDSNVITPGTPFMEKVSNYIHYYIQQKLSGPDPGWRQCKIIFSDARVPGEGEHKIMKFIRLQRAQEGYDPKTRHCLYGMDADLIMLGLASHEPYFTILREEVLPPSARTCQICGQSGHTAGECQGLARKLEEERKAGEENVPKHGNLRPFQFLHLNILREYLERDLYVSLMPPGVEWDLERMVDDFVFLCFFVGNDFLPHLPSLEIREGAIDHLIRLHKQMLPQLGGYLTENGRINMWRVAVLLQKIGAVEDETFRRRLKRAERERQRNARLNAQKKLLQDSSSSSSSTQALKRSTSSSSLASAPGTPSSGAKPNAAAPPLLATPVAPPAPVVAAAPKEANQSAAQKLKDALILARLQKKRKAEEKDGAPAPAATGAAATAPSADTTTAAASAEPESETPRPLKRARVEGDEAQLPSEQKEPARAAMDMNEAEPPATPAKQEAAEEESESSNGEGGSSRRPTLSISDALAKLKADKAAGKLAHLEPATPTTPGTPNAAVTPSTPGDSEIVTVDATDEEEGVDDLDFVAALKARHNAINEPEAEEDVVQLGIEGWKERYYEVKLGMNPKDPKNKPFFDHLFKSYAEGLAWVFEYYYRGCPSWTWYYPYHYAPMASDLACIDMYFKDGVVKFDKGKPFSPITQLMGVLPPLSSHCLPPACRELMRSPALVKYYPEKFELDLNGKRYAWQAVALLPFINEEELVSAVKSVEHTFTEEEKRRNSEGKDYIYVHQSSPLANTLYKMYSMPPGSSKSFRELTDDELDMRFEKIDPKEVLRQFLSSSSAAASSPSPTPPPSGGLFGGLRPYREAVVPGSTPKLPFRHPNLQIIEDVPVFSAEYYFPSYKEHVCKLLTKELPPRVLTEHDFAYRDNREPRFGWAPSFHQERWRQNVMEGRNFDGEASYFSSNSSSSPRYPPSPYGVPPPPPPGYAYPPPIFPGLPPPPPHLLPPGYAAYMPPSPAAPRGYLPGSAPPAASPRDPRDPRHHSGGRDRDYRDSRDRRDSRDYDRYPPASPYGSSGSSRSSSSSSYYPPPPPPPGYGHAYYPQQHHPPPASSRAGYQHPPPPPPQPQPAPHTFRHPAQQQRGSSLIKR